MPYKAIFDVQQVSQVKLLNQKPCVLLFRKNLGSQSKQWILQKESHTIDLLSIQIDKYENIDTFASSFYLHIVWIKKLFELL